MTFADCEIWIAYQSGPGEKYLTSTVPWSILCREQSEELK